MSWIWARKMSCVLLNLRKWKLFWAWLYFMTNLSLAITVTEVEWIIIIIIIIAQNRGRAITTLTSFFWMEELWYRPKSEEQDQLNSFRGGSLLLKHPSVAHFLLSSSSSLPIPDDLPHPHPTPPWLGQNWRHPNYELCARGAILTNRSTY